MARIAADIASPAITDGYLKADTFDEMVGADGRVRPHWTPVLSGIEALTHEQRIDRINRIQSRVRETGIAHDLYADPSKNVQPWRLDLMPVLFSAAQWSEIASAVAQRARLFEAILQDVYGPQNLLRSGHIPPELVFSDPSYLLACRNLAPSFGRIQFFAADLARDANGRWQVLDTHVETPAGIGYALANRMVASHVSGDLFNASRALRLASYFQDMQEALARRASRPDPAVALLTPGPRHGDYFSHSFLARYLGLLLVEGDDLRVDDGRTYLKTLDGLHAIDLVVRCVAGAQSDPLELDPQGFLGPVGLMQVVRRQPNSIANALGTALAENRGLSAYLPPICRELLGEALTISDTSRVWLGDNAQRQQVEADLDRYLIRAAGERTARPGQALRARDPAQMTAVEKDALRLEIVRDGATLVAEEKSPLATAPSYGARGLEAKPYAVRVFATATERGFVVMPCGLAMTVDPGAALALTAPDGASRDVWVLSENEVPRHTSLWRPTIEAAHLQRGPRMLPSRAADNLFWLGRYTEHADWTFRVLRNSLARIEEDTGPRQSLDLARLSLTQLMARGRDQPVPTHSSGAVDARTIAAMAHDLATSTRLTYGLPRTLDHIHRVASLTRDRLSLEAWRTLNTFYTARRWQHGNWPMSVGETLDQIDAGLAVIAAFNGLTHENMTRNYGWRLLDMGRRLSRALNMAQFLMAAFQSRRSDEEESGRLLFVLELADSLITYRSRYRVAPLLPLVLDLLVIDETNPRSLAFQYAALSEHIERLPQAGQGRGRTEVQRLALSLISDARLLDIEPFSTSDGGGRRTALVEFMSGHVKRLPQLSDAITRRYFSVVEKEAKWTRAHSLAPP